MGLSEHIWRWTRRMLDTFIGMEVKSSLKIAVVWGALAFVCVCVCMQVCVFCWVREKAGDTIRTEKHYTTCAKSISANWKVSLRSSTNIGRDISTTTGKYRMEINETCPQVISCPILQSYSYSFSYPCLYPCLWLCHSYVIPQHISFLTIFFVFHFNCFMFHYFIRYIIMFLCFSFCVHLFFFVHLFSFCACMFLCTFFFLTLLLSWPNSTPFPLS